MTEHYVEVLSYLDVGIEFLECRPSRLRKASYMVCMTHLDPTWPTFIRDPSSSIPWSRFEYARFYRDSLPPVADGYPLQLAGLDKVKATRSWGFLF